MKPNPHHTHARQTSTKQHKDSAQAIRFIHAELKGIQKSILDACNNTYDLSERLSCYELSRLSTTLCLLNDEAERLLHVLEAAQSQGNAPQLLDKAFWLWKR